MSRLLKVGQVVELTGFARSTVYRKLASGELESIKVGSLRRIPEDAYEKWVAQMRTQQNGAVDHAA